jgi:hypothetical protein
MPFVLRPGKPKIGKCPDSYSRDCRAFLRNAIFGWAADTAALQFCNRAARARTQRVARDFVPEYPVILLVTNLIKAGRSNVAANFNTPTNAPASSNPAPFFLELPFD